MGEKTCILLGAPVQEGAGRLGCDMGPSALRAAGLPEALRQLDCEVIDRGNLVAAPRKPLRHGNAAIKNLPEVVAWTEVLAEAAYQAAGEGLPIILGGDHSLAAGTLNGLSRRAGEAGREFFVLWLDAHPDFHTLDTSLSGNLHGVPVAYATGQPGFAGFFPPLPYPVRPENICMFGIRSVDAPERTALSAIGITVVDMRAIDENGVVGLIQPFLRRVAEAGGILHVSFDVDFLDPAIAPGVGTSVPGGATLREAHLIMEILHDCGLVRSLELVELNPFLDERGRTALVLVDLVESLMGRRVLDRPTQTF
ncbi:MAG TPA: arginase [Devosiaceae bacterium]|nr:arginase [Devosiaceae bacterium]